MWPAVKLALTQDGFRQYVDGLRWDGWRPSLIVLHNTAKPSLAQWIKSAGEDQAKGLAPGRTRINNLEKFFRVDNGWSGCPHLFVANDFIWIMNPLTAKGTHSPSWNSTSIGIEMIGDFAIEDDDTGEGLKVKNNTVYATAVLCEAIGIDPRTQIRLHKEDPRTSHDCPGRDIAQDKAAIISAVQELMTGGEHDPDAVAGVIAGQIDPRQKPTYFGHVTVDSLNFRIGPSASAEARGALPRGTVVLVLDRAANGSTAWLKVRSPAGYIGWVAGRFIKEGVAK